MRYWSGTDVPRQIQNSDFSSETIFSFTVSLILLLAYYFLVILFIDVYFK